MATSIKLVFSSVKLSVKCKIYEPTHEKRDLSIVRFVILQMSHLMRLWHFSSSVSSYKQPSSEASCLIFGQTLCLFPLFICANSKGSGETGQRDCMDAQVRLSLRWSPM